MRQQHLLEVARATALKTLVFPQNVLTLPLVKAAAGLLSLFVVARLAAPEVSG